MHASLQGVIVALLVSLCTLYAAWKLLPSAARRSLAVALLRVPHLPGPLDATLRRAAKAASGCGCDGCDRADKKPAAPTRTITFHPRRR